jgi:hypothetical protein
MSSAPLLSYWKACADLVVGLAAFIVKRVMSLILTQILTKRPSKLKQASSFWIL